MTLPPPPPRAPLGKTLLIRALASESRLNLLAVPIPHLIRPNVGASEKALAALFEHARAHRPCLIFLDELQALFSKRSGDGSGGGGSVGRQLLSQLLLEIDAVQADADANAAAAAAAMVAAGFSYGPEHANQLRNYSSGALVLAGATNTPAALDDALLRPGRLEHLFFVPPPPRYAREDILKRALAKMPLAGPVDVEALASATRKFSGADLMSLCQKAALEALRRSIGSPEASNVNDKGGMDAKKREVCILASDFESALACMAPSLSDQQVEEHRAWSRSRGSRPPPSAKRSTSLSARDALA